MFASLEMTKLRTFEK